MNSDFDTHLPERQQALRAKCFHATGTHIPFPHDAVEGSLVDRFEECVRHQSKRIAVRTRRYRLTYGELDALANRIAHAILARSSATDKPVALLLGHDALVIAAMLGALKAGKPYVPLDPAYPRHRLEFMLRDSTSELLLTEGRHLADGRALAGDEIQVLDIESIDAPSDHVKSVTGPRAAAFIVYTSGSTGQPKGIVQNHRNVLHDVMHYTNSGHFCPDDRFLLLSSVCFADSVRTIYGSLLSGAGLHPFDVHAEGLEPLAEWMVEQRITIYRSVPTLFRHFASSLRGHEGFGDVRLVYLGGEATRNTDIELFRRHFPRTCVLVNRLGTTETLTFRYFFLDHDTEVTGSIVPVGFAVPDQEVLVVDDHGAPVDMDAIGDVVVRSRYLSPGHWRNPELTEATFVADPTDHDLRTYRTGDLGRLGSDGCLEFLGRKDFQVKIRGYRIETAEVEAALLSLGTIREAAVIADRGTTYERLVAYVVPTTCPAPGIAEIRRLLGTRLPEYMIPSTCVVLEALPVFPNGKLNRRGLPPPPKTRPDLDEPMVAPRDSIEEELVKMWCEVLGLDTIGVHDHFLDLGGDSLAGTRVNARVRERFGLSLSVATLWQAPTVALMSALVAEHQDR